MHANPFNCFKYLKRRLFLNTAALGLMGALLFGAAASAARADEIRVMNSGGFSEAYKLLKPKFEAATGHTLVTAWGPSMGQSPEAIPNRLLRGEPADVLIMVGYALGGLVTQGVVAADSRVDLADSRIGMAIRAGSARPDISSVAELKTALLGARSIAYSDSASGMYIERELFKKLGIEQQVAGKARMIEKTPVGELVASGQYELGFQQVSEILPVAGVDFVARIPEEVQSVTVFSAGIPVKARNRDAARQLIEFMASPAARADVIKSGLDPRP